MIERIHLIRYIALALLLALPFARVVAQDVVSDTINKPSVLYSAPKRYEIADITVSGIDNYEDYVLIGLSGLSVGQVITVPGDEITNAVKRYWKHGLFSNVSITIEKVVGDQAYLNIALTQRPRLSKLNFNGVKKSEQEDLEAKLNFRQGNQITPNMIDRAKIVIKRYFDEKGFKNAEINIIQRDDVVEKNSLILDINIDKKDKVKVNKIYITGNSALSEKQLKWAMKKTNEKGNWRHMFRPKKFIDNLYDCLADKLNITGYAQGFDRKNPNPNEKLIAEAVELARNAETVLLCVGLDEIMESEGMDRLHMELSKSQKKLINDVTAVNKNVILVLSGGSPFVMPKRDVYRAAIHGYLGGQAGASAMADAIMGIVNPSGKLNESWPRFLEHNPSYNYSPSKERTAEYREGLYVGYRYYDTAGVGVRYPFGYGLSYTTFEYSDLEINGREVSFTITNTGDRQGSEVAEVYVGKPDSAYYRPRKSLGAFTKVHLTAGESRRVTLTLEDYALRYFDVETEEWQIEGGEYNIYVGASVSDIRLTGTMEVSGDKFTHRDPECYYKADIRNVSDSDYEKLLDRPIPDGKWGGDLTENDAICQLYYAKLGFARLVYSILTGLKEKSEAKGKPDLNILFIYNMPFRALAKMSGGIISRKMVDDILIMVNGSFFKGFGRLISDLVKNLKANSEFNKNLKNG